MSYIRVTNLLLVEGKMNEKQTVLNELVRHGNITKAAERAGITRKTLWSWRQKDRVFDAGVKAALSEFEES